MSTKKITTKATKKTIKKSTKKLNKLQKLYDEYTILDLKLNELLENPDHTNNEIYVIMNDIEEIKRKISNYEKNSYYPSIFTNTFSKDLFTHNDFNIYKINNKENEVKKFLDEYRQINAKDNNNSNSLLNDNKTITTTKTFEKLSPTQNLLKNFMSEYTPYRGLLIYHGTGVGKTCTAITIAENIKKTISDNKKKIHIIRYEEFKHQIFDMNKLKSNKLKEQCTKDTYVKELIKKDKNNKDLIEKCQDNPIYCNSVYIKINNLIKSYYDFKNVEKWARDTNTKINKKNKNLDSKTIHLNKINTIRREFSNSVIIIDEAHHINSQSNNLDLKLISSVLMDVLKYGLNIRLVL